MTPAPRPPNLYNHLPRKELSHPERRDVMNGTCKITNRNEEAWCSNGRFRMRDSCGNQTIVLCPCALSYGMVSICCSGAQRKLEKSPETNRIAHILLWKMQSNGRNRDCVWCEWTMVNSQTYFRSAGSVRCSSKQLQIISDSVTNGAFWHLMHHSVLGNNFCSLKAFTNSAVTWNVTTGSCTVTHSWGHRQEERPPGQLRRPERESFIMLWN